MKIFEFVLFFTISARADIYYVLADNEKQALESIIYHIGVDLTAGKVPYAVRDSSHQWVALHGKFEQGNVYKLR